MGIDSRALGVRGACSISRHGCTAGSSVIGRFRLALVLGALCAFLPGCEKFHELAAGARVSPIVGRSENPGSGGYAIKPTTTGIDDLRTSNIQPVNLDTLKLPGIDKPVYEAAASDKAARNRLQSYLETISDEACLKHKSDILAVASTVNAGFSGITSVLGGIGAIVTGVTAVRALSGSAAISNALRENFNENVYYSNIATAVVRQIDLQRQQKMQQIQPRQSESIDDYSVDMAIRDIVEYHSLCSFSVAVSALATATKRPSNADEIRGKLETLRTEYQKNSDLIAKADPAQQKILQQTNQAIGRMIQALTVQLGLVQDSPIAAPPVESLNGPPSLGVGTDRSPLDALSAAVRTVAQVAQSKQQSIDALPGVGKDDKAKLNAAVDTASQAAVGKLSSCEQRATEQSGAIAKLEAVHATAKGDAAVAKAKLDLQQARFSAAAVATIMQEVTQLFQINLMAAIDSLVASTKSLKSGTQLDSMKDVAPVIDKIKTAVDAAPSCAVANSPAAPAAKPQTKTLSGPSAQTIKDVQTALNKAGANIVVDGKMGSKTAAALKQFQKAKGLPETGEIETATLKALGVTS